MARSLVKNGQEQHTHYDEIGLCAPYVHKSEDANPINRKWRTSQKVTE